MDENCLLGMINKLIIILVVVGSTAFAQNSVKVVSSSNSDFLAKRSVAKSASAKKIAHPYDFYFDQKVREYEERMVANVKKYKKIERLMKKPQYSDPSYFGHKRKPKKRGPGKRKFCKECEIVH